MRRGERTAAAVAALQGHPAPRANSSVPTWPPRAAAVQVCALQGQPAPREYASTCATRALGH